MSGSGKRERKFFEDEKKAGKFGQSLRADFLRGKRGGIISHELAVMAGEAAQLLEPHKMTILDAAKIVAKQMEDKGSKTETLAQIHYRAILENETHWRPRYLSDMEKIPRWVGEDLMQRRVCDISPELVASALRANGAGSRSTIENRSRYVAAILNYRPKHRRASTVSIMTDAQVAAMIAACDSPEERRVVALLIYAGIRPNAEEGEISRLDWEAVSDSEIYISADVAKTRTDRHIPVKPRLLELIADRPKKGLIVPVDYKRRIQRLRKAAGIAGMQDVTRHTFASHFLAAYGEDAAKQAMGHTAGSSTLFRHYRRAITAEAGRQFFGED